MRRPIAGAASTVPLNLRERSPVAPERPPHHTPDGAFRNPWTSYTDYGPADYFSSGVMTLRKLDTYTLPISPIAWDAVATPPPADVQALWVGHATFLIQMGGWNILTDPMFSRRASPTQLVGPARYTPAACSIDELPPLHFVLMSHSHYDHREFRGACKLVKCSRHPRSSCAVDAGSIRAVLEKEKRDLACAPPPGSAARRFTGTLWICPLRVRPLLERFGVPPDQIVELDWWDAFSPAMHGDAMLREGHHQQLHLHPGNATGTAAAAPLPLPSLVPNALAGVLQRGWHPGCAGAAPAPAASAADIPGDAPTVVCVPAQHQSARTPFDRNHTLWSGFVVLCKAPPPPQQQHGGDSAAAAPPERPPLSVYFSGDTGYRSVPRGAAPLSAAEENAASCPAFREIGALYGPLDLALLPIGAYSPRWFMSSFHCTPEDAVASAWGEGLDCLLEGASLPRLSLSLSLSISPPISARRPAGAPVRRHALGHLPAHGRAHRRAAGAPRRGLRGQGRPAGRVCGRAARVPRAG